MEPDGWEQAEELSKQHEERGGLWLKLANDKDKAVVVFAGTPFARDVCFIDGTYVLFNETHKAAGERPTARIAFNVVLVETKEVKIFEQGLTFYKDVKKLRDKYGLGGWAFEIQRRGAAKDPKTTYSILPDHQLSAEEQAEFRALVLHDLQAVYAKDIGDEALDSYDRSARGDSRSATEVSTALASSKSAASAPVDARAFVDEKTIELLVKHLKKLPREAVDRFCATFGISRVKELPAAKTAGALKLLEDLITEFDPPPARAASPDPFE